MARCKFQRRHYEAIAEVIRRQPQPINRGDLIRDIGTIFAVDNPTFSRERFEKACLPAEEAA